MEENVKKGAFKAELMKNFSQIKATRAESVSEDVETVYKRKIEDLCHAIRRYDRDREDIITDLYPTNNFNNTVVPSDFSADRFLEKDLEIGINRRNAVIKLEILLDRYQYLFGPLQDVTLVSKVLPNYGTKSEEEA